MNTDITRAQVCAALRLPEGSTDFRLDTSSEQVRIQFDEECELTVVDLNSLAALFESFDVRMSYEPRGCGGPYDRGFFAVEVYDSAQCDSCSRVCQPDELTEVTGGHTDTMACNRCRLER